MWSVFYFDFCFKVPTAVYLFKDFMSTYMFDESVDIVPVYVYILLTIEFLLEQYQNIRYWYTYI